MKRATRASSRFRDIAALARDERGQMTIVSLIFFVMLMSVGGLAIDMGRLYSLQGQIQTYVDVTALASASQLDGQTNAICRAIAAAVGRVTGDAACAASGAAPLLVGEQYVAAGSHQLQVQQLTFLSALGSDPGARAATPATGDVVECTVVSPSFDASGCPANADKVTKFVEVRDTPEVMSFLLMPVMKTFVGTYVARETLGLKATGGYRSLICDATPLMICNPSEPAGNTNTLFPFTPTVGEQILMKASGSGSQWAPGDFGLVNQSAAAGGTICTGGGANAVRCMLGLVNPLAQCNTAAGIQTKPGQSTSTSDGLNVRFDIYTGAMSGDKGNASFAPAINVTKGICKLSGSNCSSTGNSCQLNNLSLDPTSSGKQLVRLPRDTNIQADGNNGTVRFGNATWDAATYWSTNHPGVSYPTVALGTTPTRFAMYRYEIDNNVIPDKSGGNGENGNVTCSSATPVNNPNRDRRLLIMAVVNCLANGIKGDTSGIPVVDYVQMFVTEPSGLDASGAPTNTSNIYGEVEGVVKPGDKTGVLHNSPALYR